MKIEQNRDLIDKICVAIRGLQIGGGGEGLVYETGDVLVEENTNSIQVNFSDTHSDTPFLAFICEDSDEILNENGSVWFLSVFNLSALLQNGLRVNTNTYFGRTLYVAQQGSTGNPSVSGGTLVDAASVANVMTNEKVIFGMTSSFVFRAEHSYIWFAIWLPT